jgi:hypothetical protein
VNAVSELHALYMLSPKTKSLRFRKSEFSFFFCKLRKTSASWCHIIYYYAVLQCQQSCQRDLISFLLLMCLAVSFLMEQVIYSEEFISRKFIPLLSAAQVTHEQIVKAAEQTVDQRDSPMWHMRVWC